MIDLRLLRCFDALLADRSVSRAAQRLALSQPAMSIALGRLRKIFEDPLLIRGRGEMVPTARALAIGETVRTILDSVNKLSLEASPFDPRVATTQFTLTAPGYIGHVVLPRLMRQLQKNAPHVRIEVRAANRERATEWLENGEIDFRMGWIREPPAALRFKTLYSDRLVCIARKEHPRLPGRLTAGSFFALPHVRTMVDRMSDSGQVIDHASEAFGKRLHIALLVQEVLTVPYIVADSNLIAVIPQRLARSFTRHLPLRIYPLPLDVPEQKIALYWHERTHRSAPHQWLRELLGSLAGLDGSA